MKTRFIIYFSLLVLFPPVHPIRCLSQSIDETTLGRLIQSFKKDDRGPYQAIRWFCPDGTIIPANQRCSQPGGIQHALHKDIVQKIARENKIYLGQILAGTPFSEFLDRDDFNSRLKQYQIEKYLEATDDGWILRQARYYRGAFQAEDEDSWGFNFLNWLVSDDSTIINQYFLVRQAAKDIPHSAGDDRTRTIRTLSKTIADSLAEFIDLRIKIHGQPENADLEQVRDFHVRYRQRISPAIDKMLTALEAEMNIAYQAPDFGTLNKYIKSLPSTSPLVGQIVSLTRTTSDEIPGNNPLFYQKKCVGIVELLWNIRTNMLSLQSSKARLAMIDLSNDLEDIFSRIIVSWQTQTVYDLVDKNYALLKGLAGCGLLEVWEWENKGSDLSSFRLKSTLDVKDIKEIADNSRRLVEWSVAMVSAVYNSTVTLFSGFEPLAEGFIDDRIRSSLLLPGGNTADQLADLSAAFRDSKNDVVRLTNQNRIRGINPGFALGELEVVTGSPEMVSFSSKKIYALYRAPANLKPVAGILTVSAGNLVSHVQLLARNLAIPNAVLSQENLRDLELYSGQKVFYAVSPGGTVIMKPASRMTSEEKMLVEERQRSEEKVTVPLDKINLIDTRLRTLKTLRAFDSGRVCGPKAANLGELKYLFPDKVVDGFIIPFAVFRQHLEQPMASVDMTYMQFLQDIFNRAEAEKKRGLAEEEIERHVLERLALLREEIKGISLLPEFQRKLELIFREVFGAELGQVPVFIRSDTNMEDLKDFTGAGLNLTVFNVIEKERIFQGIRDVWASPYTERSYRWRQKYLVNPENVYPSILIIPTVDVEKSGVLITTGVLTADPRDIFIAFNRGAGGAVEGQIAESYLLPYDGVNRLLFPCRTPEYTILPKKGGIQKEFSYFYKPILNSNDLSLLRDLTDEIKKKLGQEQSFETKGPFDVELGFKNSKIWLFQIRPYVENKRARSNNYLRSLDLKLSGNAKVSLDQKLDSALNRR